MRRIKSKVIKAKKRPRARAVRLRGDIGVKKGSVCRVT